MLVRLGRRYGTGKLGSQEASFDLSDTDILATLSLLVKASAQQGDHEQAEILFQRMLTGREIVLGLDNSAIIISVCDLATKLGYQKKLE